MRLYDFQTNQGFAAESFPEAWLNKREFFVFCDNQEIQRLQGVFRFDLGTILECADLDETIRYSCFEGYDFLSLVYFDMEERRVQLHEINLYVSKKYLILVVPAKGKERLGKFLAAVQRVAGELQPENNVSRVYYAIMNTLLIHLSDALERLEDSLQDLQNEIIQEVSQEQFHRINQMRHLTYTAKKQMRAMSYLGSHIVVDENELLPKHSLRFFKSIDTRLKKLYDLTESLYEFSNQLLASYDSKVTMKTGEMVNKLTVITLFFGPLTVITGIYGMNFVFMPELGMPFGYPLVLITMGIVCLLIYFLLRWKKWL